MRSLSRFSPLTPSICLCCPSPKFSILYCAMTSNTTLPTLRGHVTLEDALENEDDMLPVLAYPEQRTEFFIWIYAHRTDIEHTVAYHLGLKTSEKCRVGEVKEWIHGSYNVCVPVYIDDWQRHPGRRVIIRFPLPYKIGEATHPGNADEKLRCEVATFLWMREHCPDVPIPHLWAFGFAGGQSVRRICQMRTWLTQPIIVHPARERFPGYQTRLVLSTTYIIDIWTCSIV